MTAFTRQLATLVDAGLPLLRGHARAREAGAESDPQGGRWATSATAIEGGSTFSEALAQHPKIFNRLYVNMVKAGELGGVLEVVLNRLAEFMEKAQKIKGKVVAAMFYPVGRHDRGRGHPRRADGVRRAPKFESIFTDMLEGRQAAGFTRFVLEPGEHHQEPDHPHRRCVAVGLARRLSRAR